LILYVLSENKRFDPREFSIELGHKFGVRIDLRPVGVRDAARLAGGIGKCGLSMCCSTWLPDFGQVSIRMAKDQGLSLEPDSISGQCGRLLCCLGYEHQNYVEMGKGLPKVGKTVVTPIGDARVVKLDVLKGVVSVRTPEGVFETFEAKDVRRKFGPGGSQAQEQESEEEESVPELPES
jgi:cell fate regulator YaaT (PSP1 superfamily)